MALMLSRVGGGGRFERDNPMKKLIRCAVIALMFTPAMSAVQAQDMRPLSELLETAAAPYPSTRCAGELLSNLVFEACRSCGDLVGVCGFNSVFERDACDDFG
jgi:hypothetical protein